MQTVVTIGLDLARLSEWTPIMVSCHHRQLFGRIFDALSSSILVFLFALFVESEVAFPFLLAIAPWRNDGCDSRVPQLFDQAVTD